MGDFQIRHNFLTHNVQTNIGASHRIVLTAKMGVFLGVLAEKRVLAHGKIELFFAGFHFLLDFIVAKY